MRGTPSFRAHALPLNPCKTVHDNKGSTTGKRTDVLNFDGSIQKHNWEPLPWGQKADNACNRKALDPRGTGSPPQRTDRSREADRQEPDRPARVARE